MAVIYEERLSDSPFVQTIWHTQAVSDGCDMVTADGSWDMLVVRQDSKTRFAVSGPMTKAKPIKHQEGSEWLGIRFKLGTCIPYFPAENILNLTTILPDATSQSFWLGSSAWEYPDFENVDTFLERLVRRDMLIADPLVGDMLQGQAKEASLRAMQRRFLRITGLTQRSLHQIERAQQAMTLLKQGVSILDTVHKVGYTDQPHMSRSFKRFIGQTPAQIILMNAE